MVVLGALGAHGCGGAGGDRSDGSGSDGAGGDSSPPSAVDPPTVILVANALSVTLGQPIMLTWSSSDADSCTASGSWSGTRDPSGGEMISTSTSSPGESDFVLTCTGAGGTTDDVAPVTVTTELSNRVESVVAVAEDDYLYGSAVVEGVLPTQGTATPIVAAGSVETVKGGSTFISIQTAQQPTAFLVSIANLPGAPSYYVVDLRQRLAEATNDEQGNTILTDRRTNVSITVSPAAQRQARVRQAAQDPPSFDYELLLTFTSQTPEDELAVSIVAQYAEAAAPTDRRLPAASSSSLSPPATTRVRFNAAARPSQELEITLSWDADVDIDLHVQPPNGREIGFDHWSDSGGMLDVDAFPACRPPNRRVEHISWGANTPPSHVYTIRPNYYNNCGVTTPVRYVVTVKKPFKTQIYIKSFEPSEANGNTVTDPGKLVYTAMLDSVDTDTGLLSRMLLAEVSNPTLPGYDPAQVAIGINALWSIVNNRKIDPGRFRASSASTHDIITAPHQFPEFDPRNAARLEASLARKTTPPNKLEEFRVLWNMVFSVAESASVPDPFINVTRIGDTDVEPGTWGVFTAGRGSPGSTFVLEPGGTNISGQNYYSVVLGVVRR